jgi:hypothetical protein
MDSQGGGHAIKDLLQEGYNKHVLILDPEDENMEGKKGKRILNMINPTPAWISDANFDTLALLENKDLRFPAVPISGNNIEEKLHEEVKLLKSQMLNIIITETARGVRHFDTPRKGQNKDLYSALVLAAYGVRELDRSIGQEDLVLHQSGLVRPHRAGATFTRTAGGKAMDYASTAVLTKH